MLVEIENLQVSIDGAEILHDVNLSIEAGEIYGLLGPNGAGKSTTIAAAVGLIPAARGSVHLFDEDPRHALPNVYRYLGVLPEQNGMYDWMTAESYLEFFSKLYEYEPTPPLIQGKLDAVGLEPRSNQRIGTFSRGMRQRLGLARALIGDPKLLVLDEPTNGLDPRGRREIHDLLLGLASHGTGILMCTHLLDDVDRLCRRIGIIVDGRTVSEGEISRLTSDAGLLPRFRLRLAEPPRDLGNDDERTIVANNDEWWTIELPPGRSANDVWLRLLSRGWKIEDIRREGGGLEDLYLRLTEKSGGQPS